ncbi:MAG: type II secretion system F family protein [bacterium]
MIEFKYKARDKLSGREIIGIISADNELSAGKLLLKQNLYPMQIQPKKKSLIGTGSVTGRIPMKDRVVFTRQMSTLIKAGLPLATALNSAMGQVSNKKLQNIIFRMSKSVEGGMAFSQALAEYPDCFNMIYLSLVEAGEASGALDVTMERLANQIEKEAQIVSKVRGALVYPAVVMLVIVFVMAFMMASVVPQVSTLYKSFGKPLPFLTQFMVTGSDIILKYWFIFIPAFVAIGYSIRRYFKTTSGKTNLDRAKMTLPPFNHLFTKMYMGRFARTLGGLTSSGIPILEALRLVSESMNNNILQAETILISDQVKSGRSLSEALAKAEFFTPLVSQMVKVGEDSGTMGDMLDKLATFYENEVEQQIANISTLIEPVLIIFLGLMVVIIIMGVLFPVYTLVGADLSGGR